MLNVISGTLSSGAPPVAPNSYESISTVTVGLLGATSIDFTSIPSTYKHLQIRGITRGNRANTEDIMGIQFNGDTTSTNYYGHRVFGDGANAGAGAQTSASGFPCAWAVDMPSATATANVFTGAVIDILDYANTSKYKTGRALAGYDGNGSGFIALSSQLWMSTSAISSISLLPEYGTGFVQYSSFALYGIKG
jgi:hypothetical protein